MFYHLKTRRYVRNYCMYVKTLTSIVAASLSHVRRDSSLGNTVMHMHLKFMALHISARNNSRPLAIFLPISAFAQPKSVLIGHTYFPFIFNGTAAV